MLALFLMQQPSYYAQNFADIIGLHGTKVEAIIIDGRVVNVKEVIKYIKNGY